MEMGVRSFSHKSQRHRDVSVLIGGQPIHRIPARQKQQGDTQQAQVEAVESLGFAGLLRSARRSSSASWSAG
jgi:hypothetical protein